MQAHRGSVQLIRAPVQVCLDDKATPLLSDCIAFTPTLNRLCNFVCTERPGAFYNLRNLHLA